VKSLTSITPSPEQLGIIKRVRSGVELIRGAAGSGKTSTAVLKLKLFLLWAATRKQRQGDTTPVQALVLTFNKTLKGYVHALISTNSQINGTQVTVDTFSHWAYLAINQPKMCEDDDLPWFVRKAAPTINLPIDFLISESSYVLGRFLDTDIDSYATCRRDGRGASPRVDRPARHLIIDNIIKPYNAWKKEKNLLDWNDLALALSKERKFSYDVIIVDESQDLSANQLRATLNQLSPQGAATLIIDTAQRIYAGGFTWSEIGLTIRPENSHRLSMNYRNTPETAKLSAALMNCVPLDDDGTPPSQGTLFAGPNPKPIVLVGTYSEQAAWCIDFIHRHVDLGTESVAFLHPKGWFEYLEGRLNDAGLNYVVMTRLPTWPKNNVNIALSTLHSAKGLDFDYVFIIGLDRSGFPEGQYDMGDDRFENACRILAMAIARSRKLTILGYKKGEEPAIMGRLDSSTYDEVVL